MKLQVILLLIGLYPVFGFALGLEGGGVGLITTPEDADSNRTPEEMTPPAAAPSPSADMSPKDPPGWDELKNNVSNMPSLAPKSLELKVIREEFVFRGQGLKAATCLYESLIPNSLGPQKELKLLRAGYSTDKEKQELTHHCRSQNLARLELRVRELMCESNHMYVVIDRSPSMTPNDPQILIMMKKILELKRNVGGRVVVVTTDPSSPRLYDSSGLDLSPAEFAMRLLAAQGGPKEEQGFLAALNALNKYPPNGSKNSCLHLIFFADEPEQSELAYTPEEFLKKVSASCESCRRIMVHSAFAQECSAYHKATVSTGGLMIASKNNTHFETLGKLMDPKLLLPLRLPSKASMAMNVNLGETFHKGMVGQGKEWIFREDLNSLIYEEKDRLDPNEFLHVLYQESQESDSDKESCTESR